MIARDYGTYCQRSEINFQLTNNRDLPAKAADEVRNALDHYTRACSIVFGLKERKGAKQQPPTSVPLEVARCRRHLVGAQYFCLCHSIELRTKHIQKLLRSPLRGRSPQVERYSKEFLKLDEIGKRQGRKPSEKRNPTARQADQESAKGRDTNARLDRWLNRLDKIYSEILILYKGKVVVSDRND
jgi:hypothetical protein